MIGVLIRDDSVIALAKDVLAPDDFFVPANQEIVSALYSLDCRGDACLVALRNELRRRGKLAQVGRGTTEEDGLTYLVECFEQSAWAATSLEYHLRQIKNCATLRKLVGVAFQMRHDGL